MKREGWDFPEALQNLAERAGVQLRPPSPQEEARQEEHARLRGLLEEAVTFYRHQLLESPAGQQALTYLQDRSLTSEIIEAFGLGYAPKSWDMTLSYFKGKGYSDEDLQAAGLVSTRDSGGIYDRFRHRVIFPIRDARGRMCGFGARSLADEDLPKYLNTAQTEVFDKGRLLYGLDRARKTIRAKDQAVIVEGYMDVIALHQAGYENVVSPMGTALTEHQLRQLKRLTRQIILALDADAAGNQATLRGLRVARETLDRESDPVFNARGLLGYEARLQADIRVTTLPEGLDPDEVVNQNPAAWDKILAEARPIVIHVMETLAEEQDLDDPKVKTDIASQVLPLIQDVASPIERDTYRQRLARLLQVDERTLLQENYRPRTRRARRTRSSQPTEPVSEAPLGPAGSLSPSITSSSFRQESFCLGILLRRPDLIYRVDRTFQEAGLVRLSAQDFQHSDHQIILRMIKDSLDQETAEPVDFVLAQLPLSLMEQADKILAETENLDPGDPRVFRDMLRALLDLRRRNTNKSIDQIRFQMESAQEEGDIKARGYQEMLAQHIQNRALIDRALEELRKRSLTSKDFV